MNIGIDLGTSNTIVAYESEGEIHYLEYPDSDDLSGKRPAYVLPSEVFIPESGDEDNAICVGGGADEARLNRKGTMVTSPKSSIGTTEKIYDESNESYTSKEIVQMMMTKIYKSLREVFPEETVFRATVAIPVTFNTNEIKDMLEAVQKMYEERGEGICLSDIKTVHEPIAAYLACKDYEEKDLCAAENVLVIDMGGGTLDISEVQRVYSAHNGKSQIDAKRIGGDRRLGGDNFDRILGELITERINMGRVSDHVEYQSNYEETIRICSRLLKEKLQYKRDETEKANVKIDFGDAIDSTVEISRKEYYEAAVALIEQVKKEIDDAKRKSGKIYDSVLVVGGMSAEPFLKEYVYEVFGEEKTIILNPSDENFYGIVAKGAAIINGNTDLTVINRTLYSIGIKEANGTVDTIFEADTELNNLEVVREYEPAESNRYSITLPIVEFDREGTIIAELLAITIDNIPQGKIEDQTISVHFRINEERNIEVNAYAKADTTKECKCTIVF